MGFFKSYWDFPFQSGGTIVVASAFDGQPTLLIFNPNPYRSFRVLVEIALKNMMRASSFLFKI